MNILDIVNVLLILLAIIATVVVIGRLRGSRLAIWLLVIWFLPLIGPIIALFRSQESEPPQA